MKKKIKLHTETATDDDQCFVVVISSHGDKDYITGEDDSDMSILDLRNLLSAENFPAMVGKPKVVFINCCRGGNMNCHVRVL